MALALALGRRGLGNTWPNPAVGAVIVKDGVILGRGWTQPAAGRMPKSRHCAVPREPAQGATMYVTLEPCSHHGQDAALRRRHHQGRHHARRLGDGRSQSGGRGPGPRAAAREGHHGRCRAWRRGGAPRACRPHRPDPPRPPACDAQAGDVRRRQGRTRRPQAGARSPAKPRASACFRCARRATRSWSASARCCPTIRNSPAGCPGMIERSPVRVVLDAQLRVPLVDRGGRDRARDADLGFRVAQGFADRRGNFAAKRLQGFSRRRQQRQARSRARCSKCSPSKASRG